MDVVKMSFVQGIDLKESTQQQQGKEITKK